MNKWINEYLLSIFSASLFSDFSKALYVLLPSSAGSPDSIRDSLYPWTIYVWSVRKLVSYSSCFLQQTSDNTVQPSPSDRPLAPCFVLVAEWNRSTVLLSINHFVVVILCRNRRSSSLSPLRLTALQRRRMQLGNRECASWLCGRATRWYVIWFVARCAANKLQPLCVSSR